MKKIMMAATMLLSLQSAFAQFEKGSKWLGGSGGFSVSNGETDYTPSQKSTNLGIGFRASINCFKTDKVMNTFFVGTSINGYKSERGSTYIDKSLVQNFYLGIGRTYLQPLFGKVFSTVTTNFFGEYGYSKDETTNSSPFSTSTSTQKYNDYSLNANLGLGLLYRINERFAVTTTINNILYASLNQRNTTNSSTGNLDRTTKNFGLNAGFGLSGFNLGNLQFGLLYKLKK